MGSSRDAERRHRAVTSVRKATEEEADHLANVLALALFDDPVTLWGFPDVQRRRETLPPFMHLFVKASLQQREAYTVEDLSAVCLWFPPGWGMSEDEAAAFDSAIRTAAAEYAESALTIQGLLGTHHPTEPHFYLAFAGTLPDHQGRGIGSTLINSVLDRCDDGHIPAYLEASAERNRQLYERLGFETQARIDLPDGTPMWAMWREPRL